MFMVRSLLLLLIGFAGLATVSWGWAVWLPLVTRIGEDYGRTWGMVALGACIALFCVIAMALWRLQDRLTARRDGRGAPPADHVYCQRCGAAAPIDDRFCAACGSTSLSTRRPKLTQP